MEPISTKQKIVLILAGLFAAVFLLELGLRTAGFVYLSLQGLRNTPALENNDNCRILCLGESTTALGGEYSYPCQLEDILNSRDTGLKFSVINKGVIGVRSSGIILDLEKVLDRYNPDIVVTMMGINDYGNIIPYGSESDRGKLSVFLSSTRAYKLAKLLWQHIKEKKRWLFDRGTEDCNRCIELGKYYGNIGRHSEAEQMFKKAIKISPASETAYIQLGFYYNDLPEYEEARKMFEAALNINPQSVGVYIGLAELYSFQKRCAKAEELYQKALMVFPESRQVYFELGCHYRRQGWNLKAVEAFNKALGLNFVGISGSSGSPLAGEIYYQLGLSYDNAGMDAKAQEALEKCLEIDPQYQEAYITLGACYYKQGKREEIEPLFHKMTEIYPDDVKMYNFLSQFYREREYFQISEDYRRKAEELRPDYCNSVTQSSYQSLKNKVLSRNMVLVCAQYPLREVEPLKKIVGSRKGVIFVDNQEVFQKALSNGGYDEYFLDRFAVDFGHCTPKGNRLLAENIAGAILEKVFDEGI